MAANECAVLDAEDSDTTEAAERYVKRVAEENFQAPTRLAEELVAGRRRVFFSAGDLDLQALHRLSHIADTFIFADPRKTPPEFEETRQRLVNRETRAGDGLVALTKGLHPEAAYRAVTEVTGELAVMRNEAWAMVPDLGNRPAWGAVQRLKRRVGGTSRDLWLVFVAGSPVIAYERLFLRNTTAPECLALSLPRLDLADPAEALMQIALNPPVEQQWSALVGWDGELGQLIRANGAPLPKLMVVDEPMGWPTHAIWYRAARWRSRWITPVFTLRNEPWPNLASAPAGRRRVLVTRRPINPLTAKSVGAVVVNYDKFRQYCWPEGLLVIIAGPPIFPDQVVPDGPGVVNLNIAEAPLLRGLAEIEHVCAERGISSVAVEGLLGYEDEAEDLALWRQQAGQVGELIVHVDCDGHLLDFGRVADEVD